MAEGIGLTQDIFTGFTASDFGTCRAWFKADALVLNDGDAVASWTDSSGNARHATQSTGANKPLFKTGAANGQPALLFDGSNDYLKTASFGSTSQPFTVFAVVKRVGSVASYQTVYDGIASGNRAANLYSDITTGKPTIFGGTTAILGFEDFGSDWCLLSATFNGATSSLYKNEILHVTGSIGTHTLTGITIGATYVPDTYWNGYIAEIIYFDGALSAANVLAVRNYLMAKYQVSYFQPSSVTGLRSWFCADHIRGLKDGDAVSEWLDSYGAYNVTQSTGANQPLLKKFIQNNHHVVRFDGSNDYLRSAAFTASAQPRTIFIVGKHVNATTDDALFDGIGTSNRHSIYYNITTGKGSLYAGVAAVLTTNDMGTAFVLWTAVFNTTSSAIYKNGVSEATGSVGTHTLTGYTLGAFYDNSSPLNGDIAEILIYDAALSTANRQRLEGALRSKYGL